MDLCRSLAQQGHDVAVATTYIGDAHEKESLSARGNPTLVGLQKPRLLGIAFSGTQLAILDELLSRHDVVHVHGLWELTTVQLCRRARDNGVPYVISVHGMLDDWSMRQRPLRKRAFLLLFGMRWMQIAAAIHLTAKEELRQAERWLPRGKGVVIPLAFDLTPFRIPPTPELANAIPILTEPSRARILFLSRLHPKKGLDILLRAVSLLKQRGTLTSLNVAGKGDPGYLAALQTLGTNLGLSGDDVRYLGNVTGPTKLSLYAACDMLALPTAQENFGLVIIEALACGLPVLTTRAVDISTELEDSGAVKVVERTPEAFAAALEEWISNPASLGILGSGGRRWAFEKFEPNRLLAAFEKLYSSARHALSVRV